MILNGYSVVAAFLGLVQLALGVAVLVTTAGAWRHWRAGGAEARRSAESGRFLPAAMTVPLLLVAAAAWPVLFLVLQSYVPEYPEAMCIQGVLLVGERSDGASRFLPGLVELLQWTKPSLVFLVGAWLSLHLLDRRTRTGPLMGRTLALLAVAGGFAVLDAGAQLTYLALPKQDEIVASGCCTGAFDVARLAKNTLLQGDLAPAISFGQYGLLGGLVLALSGLTFFAPSPDKARWMLAAMAVAAVGAVRSTADFVTQVAAPELLGRPFHGCGYCMLAEVPESGVALGLFALGTFSVGWAALAAWLGRHEATAGLLAGHLRGLAFLGLFGYAGYLLMIAVGRAAAAW